MNRSRDEYTFKNFMDIFVKKLEEIAGEKIEIASIEGAAMAGEKYSHYCEVVRNSKEELDSLFATPKGREFTKTVQNFAGIVTIFYSNFKDR